MSQAKGETKYTQALYEHAKSLPLEEGRRLREACWRFDHLEAPDVTAEDVSLIRQYLQQLGLKF